MSVGAGTSTAAAQGYQAYDAAVNGALAKVEVGVGYKSAKHRNEEHYATSQANQLAAGGDVTLKSTQGDIALNNTQVKAGQEISVDSARAIKLASGQSQLQAQGDNKSSSVMVGVGASVGAQTGVYAYVEVGTAKGEHQLDANTQQDTTLQAQQVSLKSKHDTTLQGAQVTAKRIDADVGGKLHIESLQDQVTQSSSQSSAGVKVQAGLGTAWGASGNYANSEANGSSATVNRQSGLFAGDGGYHINAGSVQLKGGAIASTADKEHNTLSTNSFAASDITNASSFEASSVNLGAGYGSGAGQGPSFNPALPQHASGSSTTSTQATLTEGNIVINGTSTTAQALGVNTDASSAHQKTQELPGLQALQAKQQAVAQATATIAGAVQTFSQNQAKEAQKAQEAAQVEFEQTLKNSNPEGYAAYQKLDDSSKQNILLADSKYAEAYNAARDWGIGGSNSRLLNAATTLVTGVLGGQTNLQVAANTVAPYAAQAIGQAVGHGDNKNEAAQAVGHMLLGAALAYANHANPVAGGVAAVAAEKAAEYLAQHYNDGKTALDPITGQFNANLLPEEVKQEIKALTGIAASLAGAVGTIGTGSAFNAQVAGVVGQNAASSNRFLSSNEIKQAQEWAKKSGGRYTPAQIMDALRWANNNRTGKKWSQDVVVQAQAWQDGMGTATSNARGERVTVATDKAGNVVVTQAIDHIPKPSDDLIAYIDSVAPRRYSWDATSTRSGNARVTAEAAARVQREEAASKAQSEKYSYKVVSADGRSFALPYARCPAAGCQAEGGIAWHSSDANDQKSLNAYKEALEAEKTKSALTITSGVAALGYAPLAFSVGAGVNALSQLAQTGEVDVRGAVISGTAGAAGAGITNAPTVAQAMQASNAARLGISAGTGAVTNVASDVAAKKVNNEAVTTESVVKAGVAGAVGGVPRSAVLQSVGAEVASWWFSKILEGK